MPDSYILKKMKKVLFIIKWKKKVVKLFLCFLILTVCSGLLFFLWQYPDNLPKTTDVQKKKNSKNFIKTIYIPSLSLSLAVTLAPMKNGEWQMKDTKTAFFGENSAHPGKSGTTVIFAHAKDGLFANLPLLNNDDKIAIIGKNNMYMYKIISHQLVSADETSFITRHGKNQLALFTCFGADNEKRIVFIGDLIKTTPSSNFYTRLYTL